MARGAIAKKQVIDKLLSTFEGSFLYNDGKEVRIPIMEEGELIQIKVALTAAKENVEQGSENALPGEKPIVTPTGSSTMHFNTPAPETKVVEPTAEERENVKDLLAALGL